MESKLVYSVYTENLIEIALTYAGMVKNIPN